MRRSRARGRTRYWRQRKKKSRAGSKRLAGRFSRPGNGPARNQAPVAELGDGKRIFKLLWNGIEIDEIVGDGEGNREALAGFAESPVGHRVGIPGVAGHERSIVAAGLDAVDGDKRRRCALLCLGHDPAIIRNIRTGIPEYGALPPRTHAEGALRIGRYLHPVYGDEMPPAAPAGPLLDATFAELTAVADDGRRHPLLLNAMEKWLQQNPTVCFR